MDAFVAFVGRRHLGRVVVGRPAAPERDATVPGALAVDDEVAVVREGGPVPQPDLVPDLVGERLGRGHEGVDRSEASAAARHRGGVALGGEDDVLRADGPVGGDDVTAVHVGRGGLLVDRHASTLDGPGEPTDESGGVDRRAVRGPRAADRAVDRGDLLDLGRAEQPVVVRPEPPGRMVGQLHADPLQLGRVPGDGQGAALVEVAVDPLGCGHPAHLGDGLDEEPLQADGSLTAAVHGHPPQRRGEERGAPAAVASGGPVAGDLLVDDHDPKARVGDGEVVGRPQPGVAGADDRDIDVGVAGEGRPRGEVFVERVVPQAEAAVLGRGHRRQYAAKRRR